MTMPAALREAARDLEHDAEFNMGVVDRWSPERQAANSRLINKARELYERADAIEKASASD